MLTTWSQSNSTTNWVMPYDLVRYRAYHEVIKCPPYKELFGQPMKVGLKTSNLPDDAIEDIFTEEELEKVISGERGDVQNNLTEDPVEEIHVEIPNATSNDPFSINVCQE